jgi:uncharacterized protein
MNQASSALHLDIKAMAQSARHLSAQDLLSTYERIMQETQGLGADRLLDWSAQGELRTNEAGAEQFWLHLTMDTCLPLTCQRCLGLADMVVSVNRSFRFVEGEAAAEAEDELAEEDVLALSRDFNLHELMEDEVLMALPLFPRHEVCPVEVKLAVADAEFEEASTEKINPFAVLASLQKGKSS